MNPPTDKTPRRQTAQIRARHGRVKRPWFHHLLLWPILLDVDKDKRNGRLLTTREWVGWGIVVVVIAIAVIFT